ncbi:carbohydrate ABC transporter permease [Paenibacillus sp. HJGM_3]|uniref:carbohydrate ABC transporter permease n=1 Tax=Paenibacillus sp. HJGM_3 TaxID=3379816 RepID=UPI00385A5425
MVNSASDASRRSQVKPGARRQQGRLKRITGFDWFVNISAALIGISMVYPLLHILALSLSTANTVNLPGLHIIPKEFSWEGYRFILDSSYIWSGYKNTIIRVVATTALGLLVTMGYAYPLAKKKLPGRTALTLFIVVTMFASGGLIPHYLNIKNLGLLNSYWALILPLLAKPFYIIIMRNFFMGIPEELEEAAEMDGANAIHILFRIIVPVSMPVIMTISLWTIVDQWNRWFDALIYITDPAKYVLQVVLRRIIFESSVEITGANLVERAVVSSEVVKNATIIVATLPILMVYPFIQKYFVKGVMMGSLKG